MKVIKEVVSPEVSKLNHAVMDKRQGGEMQFSLRKNTRKKKMDSSNPFYESMDCVIKWGDQFINSIRVFNLSKNVYHATEKKQLR